MNRARPTWLEIDLGAIAGNVRALQNRLSGGARLMAVVKADAYGHGAVRVAQTVLQNGASALGVAISEEGVALRRAGIDAPILVLGCVTEEGARIDAEYNLAQTVFDLRGAGWLADAARATGRAVDAHIKVDTGMGRVGVRSRMGLAALADAISAEPALRLAGAFTHFAEADADDLAFTREQNARFLSMVAPLRARIPLLHAANSAALLRCPDTHHDMARAGVALYGGLGMTPAMRWVTHAAHVKVIAPGESVGYGRAFRAERLTRVMTLPVGYADGYHRAIGGRGYALVHGEAAPVIGRVCMDQAMLDVTDIDHPAVGDEAVLLGDGITAQAFGQWCGMIDYEVMLSPTSRVPREYKEAT